MEIDGKLYGSGWFCGVANDISLKCESSRFFIMRQLFGYTEVKSGVDPSKLGEAFVNFGYLGVMVMSFLGGAISQHLYRGLNLYNQKNKVSNVLIYFIVVWQLGTANLTGYFFENIVQYGIMIVALMIFSKVSDNRSALVSRTSLQAIRD